MNDFVVKNAVEVGKDTKVTLGTITSSNIDLSTGNYFSDTLAANTTYTFSNAGDVQSFQLEVTGGSLSYNISGANYDNSSKSTNPQETLPFDITFSSDGTKMFSIGQTVDYVNRWDLSTAWDVSTASWVDDYPSALQENQPYALHFKPDGTSFYILGGQYDTVFQYNLTTGYDLNTASYASKSFNVSTQAADGRTIYFKPDGTKMYVVDRTTYSVFQYSLSTAWDVSTASYDSVSLDVSTETTLPYGLDFNADGTKLFIASYTGQEILQYSMTSAYDLSTASYDSVTFSVSSQTTSPVDIAFGDSGAKMYVLSYGDDTVYQYTTGADATLTWPTSIEWAGGGAPAAPASGETDLFTFSTDDGGTTYIGLKTADNLS